MPARGPLPSQRMSFATFMRLTATERGPELVEQGLMLATALAPEVGYDRAAEISKRAYKEGKTIREVAREETDLSEEELDRLLDARKMTEV